FRPERDTGMYTFHSIGITITNDFVKGLYDGGVVDFVFKLSCVPTYRTWVFRNETEFRIPSAEIEAVIDVEAYLVANCSIDDYYDDSMNDYFGKKVFRLEDGDIVGMTGVKKIVVPKQYERVSIGSIFRFSRIPDS